MKKNICFLTMFWLPFLSFAGDAAKLNFIGFSSDGKYLAFEQYGRQDGSGFPYCETYFIEVEKNKYAKRPVKLKQKSESATLETVRSRVADRVETFLKSTNVVKGNTGNHVVSHPLTDLSADPHSVRFSVSTPLPGLISQNYEIRLTERKIDQDCYYFGKAKIVEVKLINHETGESKILQKDTRLPSSRGCPLSYRIQDVYIALGTHLAVFINVFLPGFEGQDMRYMVVTGTLD